MKPNKQVEALQRELEATKRLARHREHWCGHLEDDKAILQTELHEARAKCRDLSAALERVCRISGQIRDLADAALKGGDAVVP